MNVRETVKFKKNTDKKTCKEVLLAVHGALKQKGYDPVNQIVGYLISGDPTYVTSFNDARFLITRMERDELLEELLSFYLNENVKQLDENKKQEDKK